MFAQPMKDWMDGYAKGSISASCTVPVKWKVNDPQDKNVPIMQAPGRKAAQQRSLNPRFCSLVASDFWS